MLSMTGCSNSHGLAPISQLPFVHKQPGSTYHVQRGDTLYSIAFAYQLDYRQLAEINHMRSPYRIWPGQQLKTRATHSVYKPHHDRSRIRLAKWQLPALGRVIEGYTPGITGNSGIDIAGRYGEPVLAANAGRVVYSGDGVRPYGNLIIIKHSNTYLSAYAYNAKNLVPVGTKVHAGQEIALMGRNNQGRSVLHFEIRRNGKPVNPARYVG